MQAWRGKRPDGSERELIGKMRVKTIVKDEQTYEERRISRLLWLKGCDRVEGGVS